MGIELSRGDRRTDGQTWRS